MSLESVLHILSERRRRTDLDNDDEEGVIEEETTFEELLIRNQMQLIELMFRRLYGGE